MLPRQHSRKATKLNQLLVLFCLLLPVFLNAQQYTISTIAGGAPPPTNVSATLAAIGAPNGLALDASGNLYFSSSIGCVFKVDGSGQLTLVAGTGLDSGAITDGGPATAAKLLSPMGLAFDSSGNLYIADAADNRIRKVAPTGIISTLAGTGTDGYFGDGSSASSAQLNQPTSLALDARGNVYIADSGNDVIRKVSVSGIISTIAGNGYNGFSGDGGTALLASLNTPSGVTVDGSGNLFIADQGNHCIREVSPTGLITTVAGTGAAGFSGDGAAAINATLNAPQTLAVAPGGILYIADTGNGRVRKVNASGIISTVAGNGASRFAGEGALPTSVGLDPFALLVDRSGNLDIADAANNGVRQVIPALSISTLAGNGQFDLSGDGGPATNARFELSAITIDSTGILYLADASNHTVRAVATDGTIETFAGQPFGIPAAPGVEAIDATLTPQIIAVDAAQNLYVGNGPDTIEISPAGTITSDLTNQNLQGVDSSGIVYSYDSEAGPLLQQSSSSQPKTSLAGGGLDSFSCGSAPELATNIQLGWLTAMAVSPLGAVYFSQADFYSGEPDYCVFEVSAGIVGVAAGSGQPGYTGDGGAATLAAISEVTALSADSLGRLYFADLAHVRLVSPGGIVNTIAGTQTSGSSGDGGVATNAQITALSLASLPNGTVSIGQKFAVRLLAPPAATSVAGVTSSNANGTYGVGATITIHVDFSAAVTVTGTPQLSLNTGAVANYSSGSGSATLTFLYTVASGDTALRLDYANASSLLLNGGSLVDALENAAMLTLPLPGAPGSLSANSNIVIQAAPPTYTISGQLTSSGQPLANATVSLSPGPSVLTDASGLFSFASLPTNTAFTVTPEFSGFTFVPAHQTFISLSANQTANFAASLVPGALTFIPLTPCRVADTRNALGPFGGPAFAPLETRTFLLPNAACGIPPTAAAYSLNVTVVPTGALNYLSIWPAASARPSVSTLNSDGRVKANAAIVPAGPNGGINLFVTNQTHVILDINGYFLPAGAPNALAFYPLAPCRVVDTRAPAGPLAGPTLAATASRSLPLLASSCGLPTSAQAYSLNYTALPSSPLNFLTTWPTGQAQPVVSTLNASTAQVTANAAIVPAGASGSISVFASNATDLLIDVNGYFAPPAGKGLALYPVTPCRAADSRSPAGSLPTAGTAIVPIATACNTPVTAQAFILNATVVPVEPLQWLTLWPNGLAQPGASTLNAYDGAITSNLAIIPSSDGSVAAFSSNHTYLILDLSGFFAP